MHWRRTVTVLNPFDIYALLLLLLLLLLRSRFSRVRVCVTPWTAAYQALQSMRFSRQEYWSGLPLMPDVVQSMLPLAFGRKVVSWVLHWAMSYAASCWGLQPAAQLAVLALTG